MSQLRDNIVRAMSIVFQKEYLEGLDAIILFHENTLPPYHSLFCLFFNG
jgi:hypothetical protein